MPLVLVGDRPFDPTNGPLLSTYQSIHREEQYAPKQPEQYQTYNFRTAKEALSFQFDVATGKAGTLLKVGWNTVRVIRTVGGGFTVEVWFQYPPHGEDTLAGGSGGDLTVTRPGPF